MSELQPSVPSSMQVGRYLFFVTHSMLVCSARICLDTHLGSSVLVGAAASLALTIFPLIRLSMCAPSDAGLTLDQCAAMYSGPRGTKR